MVLAGKAGPDPAKEALRRLGVMRVATKYPRIAARHFEETGRQAEIVEVKGSVELAPLTGMVEAIVDLTATGTTLKENNLVVREEIVVCTARLIANPVSHKLKAAAIDDLLTRLRALAGAPAPAATRARAGAPSESVTPQGISAGSGAPTPS
jgi:ATP phosphoribosyltransferase